MSILFSFIVFILCSNLYIIVDFCAKSIFFYDIYVKDSREKKKKKSHFGGTSSCTYQLYNSYVSIFCPYFWFFF
jgi:hypothetical protein